MIVGSSALIRDMFVVPTVSVRGVAVTSGAWSAMYRNDSMLMRVDISSQKFVLLGRVNGSSTIQVELLNGPEYLDVISVVLFAIVNSDDLIKEAQPEKKLLKIVPLLVSNTSGNIIKEGQL